MKLLWIDDLRNPFLNIEGTVPKESTHIEWVLNYEQFTQWIERFGLPDIISFDHDLADVFSNDREERTGMDCAKWLVDYCLDNKVELPAFYVHSANPVGAENINSLLNNFNRSLRLRTEDDLTIQNPIREQNKKLFNDLSKALNHSKTLVRHLKENQTKMQGFENASSFRTIETQIINALKFLSTLTKGGSS